MCYPSKNAMKKLPGLSRQNDDVNKEKWLGEIHIDPEPPTFGTFGRVGMFIGVIVICRPYETWLEAFSVSGLS